MYFKTFVTTNDEFVVRFLPLLQEALLWILRTVFPFSSKTNTSKFKFDDFFNPDLMQCEQCSALDFSVEILVQ